MFINFRQAVALAVSSTCRLCKETERALGCVNRLGSRLSGVFRTTGRLTAAGYVVLILSLAANEIITLQMAPYARA